MLHAQMKPAGGALSRTRVVIGWSSSFGCGELGKLHVRARFLKGSEISGAGKAAVSARGYH